MPHADRAGEPSVADFYARHRGGGLFSEHVSQRAGARLALAAYRMGLSPAALTLAGLGVGVGASVVLAALAPRAAAGELPAWVPGLAAALAWQLAYAFDCADGQLARVTGRTSAAGARLDILADVAVQVSIVTALGVTAASHAPATPAWLIGLFAASWMVNLVTSVLAAGPAAASLVTSRSAAVRVAKLVRDYGAVVLAGGLVATVAPAHTGWLLLGLALLNSGFLGVSVGQAALAASRRSDPAGRPSPSATAAWQTVGSPDTESTMGTTG